MISAAGVPPEGAPAALERCVWQDWGIVLFWCRWRVLRRHLSVVCGRIGAECCSGAGEGIISGIRTAELRNIWENAEEVPEMMASPALEQQNRVILGKMLKECRR